MERFVSSPLLEQLKKECLYVLSQSDGDDREVCAQGKDWEESQVVAQNSLHLVQHRQTRGELCKEIECVDIIEGIVGISEGSSKRHKEVRRTG